MDHTIKRLETSWMKKTLPAFNIGDTVKVHAKVVEGEKERIQVFEGVVIGKKKGGNREVFTVRKISYGVGVERVFPIHSPFIQQIQVVRAGSVRRAKLYYLRERQGKAAYIAEKEFSGKAAAAVPAEETPSAAEPSQGQETVSVKE